MRDETGDGEGGCLLFVAYCSSDCDDGKAGGAQRGSANVYCVIIYVLGSR